MHICSWHEIKLYRRCGEGCRTYHCGQHLMTETGSPVFAVDMTPEWQAVAIIVADIAATEIMTCQKLQCFFLQTSAQGELSSPKMRAEPRSSHGVALFSSLSTWSHSSTTTSVLSIRALKNSKKLSRVKEAARMRQLVTRTPIIFWISAGSRLAGGVGSADRISPTARQSLTLS